MVVGGGDPPGVAVGVLPDAQQRHLVHLPREGVPQAAHWGPGGAPGYSVGLADGGGGALRGLTPTCLSVRALLLDPGGGFILVTKAENYF